MERRREVECCALSREIKLLVALFSRWRLDDDDDESTRHDTGVHTLPGESRLGIFLRAARFKERPVAVADTLAGASAQRGRLTC